MAFIDFSGTAAEPRASSRPIARAAAAPAAAFTPIERRVLELSQRDGLDTLRPPARRSWLGRLLFGAPPPPPRFASDRLEALRRLAVETRHHGWRVRSSAIAAARAAGFTEAQIGHVIDTIGHAAPVRRTPA